jgi:hypothetical protein
MDIRAERLAAGKSKSMLARAARVSQPDLSAFVNNRRTRAPKSWSGSPGR